MNEYRAEHHLPPLREDVRLDAAAGDRMRDMEDQAYWAHESPDGRSPFTWLEPNGYTFHYAGENLATGFDTTEVLVEGWMESPRPPRQHPLAALRRMRHRHHRRHDDAARRGQVNRGHVRRDALTSSS